MSLIDRCAQCDAPLGYRRSGHSWCEDCRNAWLAQCQREEAEQAARINRSLEAEEETCGMSWQVGDLALCLKNDWTGARYGSRPAVHPEQGKVYRVESIQIEGEKLRLRFGEFGLHAWNALGFRKIKPDEQEACEPEFVKLLRHIKNKEVVG